MVTEKRLIDANALDEMCRRQIESTWNHNVRPESWARAYEVFLDAVNDSLTVDAVEVVHGRWVKRTDICDALEIKEAYSCSECGKSAVTKHNFCSRCGAKMDGERKQKGNAK